MSTAQPLTASPADDVSARPMASPWPIWPWLCLVVLAVLETIWLSVTDLSLSDRTAVQLVNIGSMVALFLLLARRLGHLPRLHTLCNGFAFLLAAWPILRLFNHLTTTLPFPMADAHLAAWDAAIGFDWLAYVRWIDGQPWLLSAMALSYNGLTGYTCILFLFLAAGRESEARCRELVELFLSTALVCSSIGALLPALAPMGYYAPPGELFNHITTNTGCGHIPFLEALRNDPAHVLDLSRLPGLVTLPSFHTAMGVLAIYCARGTHWLFVPMVVVNLIMIASTPVFGSHYAVDVIAGAAVAIGAILVHRRRIRSAAQAE